MDSSKPRPSAGAPKDDRPSSPPKGSSGLSASPMDVDDSVAQPATSSSNSASSAEPARNSRCYSTARLRSFTGYAVTPPIDVGLDFRLPSFKSYHSRVVKIGIKQYLIWSPNSRQDPYYPGPYILTGQVATATELNQRRFDGQGGPSDYTKVPQVYQKRRPWLGFILRESLHPQDVEYTPVYSVWRDPAPNEAEGDLCPTFIDQLVSRNDELDAEIELQVPRLEGNPGEFVFNRPCFPSAAVVQKLREVRQYEKAVNLVTEVQRGMREKGTWLTMMTSLIFFPNRHKNMDDIIPADDRFLGVWINDAERDDLPEDEPVYEDALPDFFQHTEIQEFVLTPASYEYDRIGLDPRYRYTTTEFHRVPHAPVPSNPGPWSDLRRQLYIALGKLLPRDRPAVRLAQPPFTSPVGLLFAQQSRDFEERRRRVAEPPASTSRPSPTMEPVKLGEAVVLDPARTPWLQTPPIAEPGRGKWTTFREETDPDDKSYLQQLGKSNPDRNLQEGDVLFYDRRLNRRLIFAGSPPLEGEGWLTTGQEYGRPAPQWPYLGTGGQKLGKLTWMYSRERPNPADVGRRPVAPNVQQLPTIAGGQFEEADGAWAREDEPEHDSDAVSLGDYSGVEVEASPAVEEEVEITTGNAVSSPSVPAQVDDSRVHEMPVRPAPMRKAGWNHYSPYQPLTGPNSIPGRPVLAAQPLLPPPAPRPSTPPRGRAVEYRNALASSSQRPMDSWQPRFGPASSRFPNVRVSPTRPLYSAPPEHQWRRDQPRSPPPRKATPSPPPRRRSSRNDKQGASLVAVAVPLAIDGASFAELASLPRFQTETVTSLGIPISIPNSTEWITDEEESLQTSSIPFEYLATTQTPPPVYFFLLARLPTRAVQANTAGPNILPFTLSLPQTFASELGIEPEGNFTESIFQRIDVPLESRIGEVRRKKKRVHKRAERRANRLLKETFEAERLRLDKDDWKMQEQEVEDRIMQEVLMHDAAAQPAPETPAEDPYEEPPYPEDWYN
ncbi:hypothetical protein B0H16DRAFT_1748414 [Mycena metata]|uniref:Uncharacterized protein n=1 Tax=Mycena metata TaxID=1033252 RepID=A0AAD7DWV4_9AGAR|nr:hypothetical protein B0H16DRAFT_1748414 [Mycena metata]